MTLPTNHGSALAPLSRARKMLAEATTIEQILQVENLAQRAKEIAAAAGMGREACNSAAHIMLDARRKAGDSLRLMKERGELAEGRRPKLSQAAIVTLDSLDLTLSQSSRYQQEASVPAIYDKLAKERQKEHGRTALGKNTSGIITGSDARDSAGKAVGVSGSLIDRARKVVYSEKTGVRTPDTPQFYTFIHCTSRIG